MNKCNVCGKVEEAPSGWHSDGEKLFCEEHNPMKGQNE